MANPVVNCQANSLLELAKAPDAGNPHPQKRFFYADFTRKQMNDLVQKDNTDSIFAGICVVTGNEGGTEVVYAFRVQWSGANLVRSPELNIPIITNVSIPEIPPVPGAHALPLFEKGEIKWRQQPNANFLPEVAFVFVDAFTINKVLADTNPNLLIRIRKSSIRSRIKNTNDDDGVDQKFSNYIVETVPTFLDKYYNPPAGGLTDKDVVAYDYGYPCPPLWNQANNTIAANLNKSGFGIIKRSQVIHIANGNAITMGAVVDALWNNTKARNLLSNWTLYTESKGLQISDKRGGHIV